eukprot:PhM_4_TR9216/c0_g1_i1/m.64820/K07874/RAB1A; Ras-related protein Rab-1A
MNLSFHTPQKGQNRSFGSFSSGPPATMPTANDTPPVVLKFVLLGESSVGKSSLVVRFCDRKFTPQTSTVGIDFKWQDIVVQDTTSVRLHLWDTAGQEKYRGIAKPYYRQADGVVLVYDVTSKHSLHVLDSYLADVRELCPLGALIILVGNKCDVDADKVAVSFSDAQDWAKQRGIMLFFETSAKHGTRVDEAFHALAEHCVSMRAMMMTKPEQHIQPKSVLDDDNGGADDSLDQTVNLDCASMPYTPREVKCARCHHSTATLMCNQCQAHYCRPCCVALHHNKSTRKDHIILQSDSGRTASIVLCGAASTENSRRGGHLGMHGSKRVRKCC